MTTHFDVIVVGGGLAGLAAGATAAQAGARTVVLDAHTPGGRARVVERDGFTFNIGAHALYNAGPGREVLAALGVTPAGAKPPVDTYRIRLGGANHVFPATPGQMLRTRALTARSKVALGRLMLALPRFDAGALAGISVNEWLGRRELPPDARAVAGALVRIGTYAHDHDDLSAEVAVVQLQSAVKHGVLYLDGGWRQLIDGLGRLVEVRTGCAVRAVEPAAGRVEVVTDDGPLIGGTVVVATGTPAAVRALLPAEPAWGDIGEPVTAAALDVAVRRIPEPGYVLSADDPVYATRQAPPARQAPAGQAVMSVLRYGARAADLDRPQLEQYLHHAGVRPEDIVHDRFLASMVVTGTQPRARLGGLAGRPRVDGSGCAGVYIAGDWIGPSGLLADASLASGHAAGLAAAASRPAATVAG